MVRIAKISGVGSILLFLLLLRIQWRTESSGQEEPEGQNKAKDSSSNVFSRWDFSNVSAAVAASRRRSANESSQRILVLPGPHKTGTTLVQACLYERITRNRHAAFQNWVWPLPSQSKLQGAHIVGGVGAKGFAPLLSVLRNDTKFTRGPTNTTEVIKVYRDAVQTFWKFGYNIVLGAEAMDYVASDNVKSNDVMAGIVAILPPEGTIEVLVNVRLPKVEHLKSIWHNHGAEQQSFSEWLRNDYRTRLFMLDSLRLALRFLQYSNRTNLVLLDVQGLDRQAGVGMCDVVACDVMNVACIDHRVEGKIEENNHTRPDRAEMDLSSNQVEALEDLFATYDCGLYSKVMESYSDRVSILYKDALFESCDSRITYPMHPLSWLRQHIESIVGSSDSS